MASLGLLQTIAPLASLVPIALVASRRRLIRTFLRADATSAARAIAPDSRLLGRFWTARLQRAGVLHASAPGALWLDAPAWAAYRAVRRTRALIAVGVGLAALLLVLRPFG